MENKTVLKKTRFIIDIVKEKLWLEEMALEGWVFSNLNFGIFYSFTKETPKKLIYEIDRFNLPRNPTLKEIKHKEEFMGMATEMGWEVVLHDEDQNHYFCKEYIEGEINELYNDRESREIRSQKYLKHYKRHQTAMLNLSFFVAALNLILAILDGLKLVNFANNIYTLFLLSYLVFTLASSFLYDYLGQKYYKDLLMTSQEWLNLYRKNTKETKTLRKLLWSNHQCHQFFNTQSKLGWHITNMATAKYTFTSGPPANYTYAIDSKHLTNKRIRARGATPLKDKKDWMMANNDWQIQSLKDAESKGWTFAFAIENQYILYRSPEDLPQAPAPLNDEKLDKSYRYATLAVKLGAMILVIIALAYILGYGFGSLLARIF